MINSAVLPPQHGGTLPENGKAFLLFIRRQQQAIHTPALPHIRIMLLMLLIGVFTVACGQGASNLSETQQIQVMAPQSATRGQPIQVTVQAHAINDNEPVGLVMVGVNGARVYSGTVQNGQAQFIIPTRHTQFIGYVALIATVGSVHGEASIILLADDSA